MSWLREMTQSLNCALERSMAARLYVGNLPYSVGENELRRLFGQAGTVESVTLPLDRETGRPRGFGFVQMADDEEANTAIQMFNGYNLEGRQLRVNLAQEREMRHGGGGGYTRRAG
jgi:cold-inducible RNA-binding protein